MRIKSLEETEIGHPQPAPSTAASVLQKARSPRQDLGPGGGKQIILRDNADKIPGRFSPNAGENQAGALGEIEIDRMPEITSLDYPAMPGLNLKKAISSVKRGERGNAAQTPAMKPGAPPPTSSRGQRTPGSETICKAAGATTPCMRPSGR